MFFVRLVCRFVYTVTDFSAAGKERREVLRDSSTTIRDELRPFW